MRFTQQEKTELIRLVEDPLTTYSLAMRLCRLKAIVFKFVLSRSF